MAVPISAAPNAATASLGGSPATGGDGPISLLLLLLSIAVVTVSFDRARYWLQWWRQRRQRQNHWEQTATRGPDAIENQLLEWNSQMAFGEPLLQAAGVIGPLLGLIGTVFGLMRVLASLGPQLVLPAGANLNNYSQVLLSTALGLIISLIATSSLFANQGIRQWQVDGLRRRLRLRAQTTKP